MVTLPRKDPSGSTFDTPDRGAEGIVRTPAIGIGYTFLAGSHWGVTAHAEMLRLLEQRNDLAGYEAGESC